MSKNHLWNDWSLEFLVVQGFPVESSEPSMFFDQQCSSLHDPQSLGGSVMQQLGDQVDSLFAEVTWECDLSMHDLGVCLHRILIIKWWIRRKHLIDQNSQCPPIHTFIYIKITQIYLKKLINKKINKKK